MATTPASASGGRKLGLNLLGRVPPSPKTLFAIAVGQQLLGSGIIFGWPSLQALMQSERVFLSTCPFDTRAAYIPPPPPPLFFPR
jgi:hypothetical protein